MTRSSYARLLFPISKKILREPCIKWNFTTPSEDLNLLRQKCLSVLGVSPREYGFRMTLSTCETEISARSYT